MPAALRDYERRRYLRTAPLVRRSRRFGRLAQLRNPSCAGRDAALRRMSGDRQLRQLEPLLRVP